MPSKEFLDLHKRITSGIANGLNAAAEEALRDIKGHVQVRTGNLRSTYAITQRATPASFEVRIDSPLNYKQWQYPNRIPERIPRDRNRALQGNPLFDGKRDPDSEKFQKVAIAIVTNAIENETT